MTEPTDRYASIVDTVVKPGSRSRSRAFALAAACRAAQVEVIVAE